MLRMPRRRTVTLAIVDGAQVRSALHNLAADARAGRRIVIALRERRAARIGDRAAGRLGLRRLRCRRSEEHTSELQSLMRISYAVFCLKKKTQKNKQK